MQHRREQLAQEWLRRAHSNLARALAPKPVAAYWEDLCFDAQQAAEKALKAVFVFHGKVFPFTHDIGQLVEGLESFLPEIPQAVVLAKMLSDYAVATRYPSWGQPVTEEEFKIAIQNARAVVDWAAKELKAG